MKTIVATQTIARKTISRRNAIIFAWLLFVGVLVYCVSLALVTRAHNAKMLAPKAAVAVAFGAGTQAGQLKLGPVQVVRFALYDVGIYPHEAQVRKGLVGISFEDLSGGASDVVVTRETGAVSATTQLIASMISTPGCSPGSKTETGL